MRPTSMAGACGEGSFLRPITIKGGMRPPSLAAGGVRVAALAGNAGCGAGTGGGVCWATWEGAAGAAVTAGA